MTIFRIVFYFLNPNFLISFFAIHKLIGSEEYCQFESFKPQCLRDELLLITSATFGRMKFGRCIKEIQEIGLVNNPKYIGCSADVTDIANSRCFAKQGCELKIPDPEMAKKSPCHSELITYLDVTHQCLKIAQENSQCSIALTTESTLHLFRPTSSSNCGSKRRPWLVETFKGQKINSSMIQIGTSEKNKTLEKLLEAGNSNLCSSENIVGYSVDKNEKTKEKICSGSTNFFTSSSNSIEIYFEEKPENYLRKNEVIKLSATGCSDLIPPADAWLKRTENEAIIGCYSTRLRWQLKCQGERWIGVIGNCSVVLPSLETMGVAEKGSGDHKSSQVLVIAAICSFGLILCITILCLGIICMRRYSTKSKLAEKMLSHQHQKNQKQQGQHHSVLYGNNLLSQQFNTSESNSKQMSLVAYHDGCYRNVEDGDVNNQYFVLDGNDQKND